MTTPREYEKGLAHIIKFNEQKRITDPPLDLQCSPYRDDPDHADRLALRELQAAGVVDSFKLSKKTVRYGQASGPDQCQVCANWEGPPAELSSCKVVGGAVRAENWCTKFSKGAEHGQELDQGSNQAAGPVASGPGSAAGTENSGQQAGGGQSFGQPQGPPAGGLG